MIALAAPTSIWMAYPIVTNGPPASLQRLAAAARACGYPPRSVVRGIFSGQPIVMLPDDAPRPGAEPCIRAWMGRHPTLGLKRIGG